MRKLPLFIYFRFLANRSVLFQLFCVLLDHPHPDFHKCIYAWSEVRAVCGPLVIEKHRRKPHNITIECEPALCGKLLHARPIVCSLPLSLKIHAEVSSWKTWAIKHLVCWRRVCEVVLEYRQKMWLEWEPNIKNLMRWVWHFILISRFCHPLKFCVCSYSFFLSFSVFRSICSIFNE